jgi:hypothetical protein
VAVKLHRCPVMLVKMAGTIRREESGEPVARIKDGRLAGEAASPQ